MVQQLLTILFISLLSASLAGQRTVTGTVTDEETGEELISVTVAVKGTTTGAITDFEGNYSIQASPTDTLAFSYVGYDTQEVPVGQRSQIDVALGTGANQLEEVVVVGYGKVSKKDLTGSVTTINPDEVKGMPIANAEQLLQGRSSGVQVTRNSGAPGASSRIRIRGVNSINSSNSPLVVIDGFLGGDIDEVNPNDIERIDVLKDASALAIYGARASNGVIIITTKSGKAGRFNIDFNFSQSFQQITEKLDVLNSQEYGFFVNEALRNDGDPRRYPRIGTRTFPTRPEDIDYNVDWHDEVYQPGSLQEYQLSLSGGNEKIQYFVSGAAFDQDGIIPNSEFTRYSGRINLTSQMTDWLEVGTNTMISRRQYLGETGFFSGAGISNDILGYSPLFTPRDTLGNWNFDRLTTGTPTDNPLAVATIPVPLSEILVDYINPRFYADFKLLPELTFRATAGFERTNRTHGQALLQESIAGNQVISTSGLRGRAWTNNSNQTRYLIEGVATYDRRFNDNHKVQVVLGGSEDHSVRREFFAEATGFTSDAVMQEYHNLGAGDPLNMRTATGQRIVTFQSVFGRLNYDLTDRYSFTLNFRRDGASTLAEQNKWGTFPSAAVAWKAHNEAFMGAGNFISELKFRASYGQIGNALIPSFASLARFQPLPGSEQPVITPVSVANPSLGWENTTQLDIGIDLGLWEDRVTVTADVYDKVTDNLLLQVAFPASSGFREGWQNVGEVRNYGVEFNLHSVNVNTPAFEWETNFNISLNRNRIERLDGDRDVIIIQNGRIQSALNGPLNRLVVGEPISTFYGSRYAGVVDDPTSPSVGLARYEDLDGDGNVIDDPDDRTIIGSAFPDLLWGLNNSFFFAGFELGIFINASHGADIYNLTRQRISSMTTGSNQLREAYENRSYLDGETWVFTGFPKASNNNKLRASDRFIEDGSFVRLQNVSLTYGLPTSLVQRAGLRSARVFVSGQNLLLWTDYSGYDPEVNRIQGNDTEVGIDDGAYPNVRSITVGAKIGI
jgi:TonB-linked SusC/RagA family outer membrane protein